MLKLHVILPLVALCTAGIASGDSSAQEFEDLGAGVRTVAENLEIPWSIDFAADGRIFFTERTGNLRIIDDGMLLEEPALSLDVGGTEGGMLGLALDPDFGQNHYVYLYYTYDELLGTYNRVVRYTESDNVLQDEKILIDGIPGSRWHDGGRIRFGPDGMLYVTTGDASNYNLAQDTGSLAGKILRINRDGSIPGDNPLEGSPVYSWGHRNPQGIDWHPESGMMVATEHGPSGERGFAHDEINRILPGQNYGWPTITGDQAKDGLQPPLLHTGDDVWAPSGASFYDSENIPGWKNTYFVATLGGSHLRMLDIDPETGSVLSSTALFSGEFGRLRDVMTGPDGDLYVLTSNRDGRGEPAPNDDRILRIAPARAPESAPIRDHAPEPDIPASPREQAKSGIDPHHVKCRPGLELVFKADWSPACARESTVHRLIQTGWAADHDPSHMINKP